MTPSLPVLSGRVVEEPCGVIALKGWGCLVQGLGIGDGKTRSHCRQSLP